MGMDMYMDMDMVMDMDMGNGFTDTSHGSMDMGHGSMDMGQGSMDMGQSSMDMGHGSMDMGPQMEACCAEKMVGSVSYTLVEATFHGAIPHQCLNDCVYTVTGTSSPKFCFQRGDLPTECLDSPEPPLATTDGTTAQGSGSGHSTVGLAI